MTKAEEDQVRRIEQLVRRIDEISDPDIRGTASELVSSILSLHGSGLERMMELVAESSQAGETIMRRFANDTLVASLLVLHGLHPDDLETRVRQVLAKQSTRAELMGVFDGVVRVRVAFDPAQPNLTATQVLRSTLFNALPDAAEIIVEEVPALNGFVPLAALASLATNRIATED